MTIGHTALCIDDGPSNLELIGQIFELFTSIRLLSATHGKTGCEMARTHKPDMILLDLNLSDMSGRDVLRHLKADEQTQNIPVIVLSAEDDPGQIEKMRASGAHAYMTKPLEIKNSSHY